MKGLLSKCTALKVRFVTGPSDILFTGVYVCTSQPGHFTGWGSERVNPKQRPTAVIRSFRAISLKAGKYCYMIISLCSYPLSQLRREFTLPANPRTNTCKPHSDRFRVQRRKDGSWGQIWMMQWKKVVSRCFGSEHQFIVPVQAKITNTNCIYNLWYKVAATFLLIVLLWCRCSCCLFSAEAGESCDGQILTQNRVCKRGYICDDATATCRAVNHWQWAQPGPEKQQQNIHSRMLNKIVQCVCRH